MMTALAEAALALIAPAGRRLIDLMQVVFLRRFQPALPSLAGCENTVDFKLLASASLKEPIRQAAAMSRRQIDRMVSQLGAIVGEMQTVRFRYVQHGRQGWEPLMNVYRYREHYEICVELAGVALEDLRLGVNGRRITVSGVRHWPDLLCKVTESQCHRTTLMEIEDGAFWREIELPEEVDGRTAQVTAQQGLVWIRLQIV